MSASAQPQPKLERLLRFLERDPGNPLLLADAASAAFDERDFVQAADLIARHEAIAALSPALTNLKGLTALAQQRYEDAIAIFEALRADGQNDPALRFNLAWSKAMVNAWQDALDLLDDDTLAVSLRAPALKIQMMHHLELYDDALTEGARLAERFPGNQALMGTMATLAMDAERIDLAKSYAERAGDDSEGLAALGMLTLGEHDVTASLQMFDGALRTQPNNPRAWLGKGLALMMSGDGLKGADALEKGAGIFQDHLGSWVAAGWAHYVNKDIAKARASFEHALALDPNFAESHGGLAVVNIAEGKLDDARRNSDIALRLDKNCFGGALAKSLLLQERGNTQAAQKIVEMALSTPVGPGGQTIAQAIMGFGSRKKQVSSQW
jgi:tetratricopeptide (TPR) repeat protein